MTDSKMIKKAFPERIHVLFAREEKLGVVVTEIRYPKYDTYLFIEGNREA